MLRKHSLRRTISVLNFLLIASLTSTTTYSELSSSEVDFELKLLGKYIFFDKISRPSRMACATCHDPDTGGTGSISGVNLHQVAITGADPHTTGALKPPTNAYASLVPPFHECGLGGVRIGGFPTGAGYCGGNFWNGRAEGADSPVLPGATKHIGVEVFQGADPGNPIWNYAIYFGGTSDQALNPMPNPVEQNIERQAVCEHVANAKYAELYEIAWGETIDCSEDEVSIVGADVSSETKFDISFKRMMLAIGAWQSSADLNSFSSRRDVALRQELACFDAEYAEYYDAAVCKHADYLTSPGRFPLVGLTDQENLGHDLFYNTNFPPIPGRQPPRTDLPTTNCSFCHLSESSSPDGTGVFERYTDDAYHNIGIPVNPLLPADPDPGIAGHAEQSPLVDVGGFRTPTLRNVDKRKGKGFTKAYGHNGWFKSLESIVHFYNTGKSKPFCESVIPYPGPFSEKDALAFDCWPEPEWPQTVATPLLVGALGMSPDQEAALVAYLKTLTDQETATPPKPYKSQK
ncbi:cytochrome-c peroxidase [Ketobacter sp.]|uniref:cytochrome-c peroxidase n=1 Tax=Ketobacter sp. TaxID=2083498 RepID=UPI0025BEE36E|nr:cytochrome c peroxidase [Ketobacter sp.]